MLKLHNINLSLNSKQLILKNLNLEIQQGEFVVIIGANGSGKSTLLNVISGSLITDQGQIILSDQDITKLSAANRSHAIAKVLQDPKIGTMENMTIYENLAFAYMRGKRRGLGLFARMRYKKLFKEKLAMLGMGLENRMHELVANLSGGQRQGLSLIMSIIADSKVLLLDEITASLDPKTAEQVMQIADLVVRSEKRSTIMITHNMQHAISYGDRILLLKDGNIKKEITSLHKASLQPSDLMREFIA